MNHFSIRVVPDQKPGVIISVSKKVSKKAVTRNKIKRRVRAALRNLFRNQKPKPSLIIAKPGAEQIKGEDLANELKTLFKL
jgi:ribonuclease P protein component